DAPVLADRIRAELDGSSELSEALLRRAAPHLTTPERVARAVGALASEALCGAAFTALVQAGRFDRAMLPVAARDPNQRSARLRDLLRLPRDVVPDDVARSFLTDAEASVRLAAVHHLAAPGLDEATVAALAERLASDPDDRVRAAAARALTSFGSEEHAAAAFRATFGTGFGEEAVDWLIEHPRPAW